MTTSTLSEVLKQMVDVLEYWDVYGGLHQPTEDAIEAGKQAIAELESQEPVACVHIKDGCLVASHRDQSKPFPDGQYGLWPINTHPPQRTEQNFCPRCGKRTKDLTHIHTCTPPQD